MQVPATQQTIERFEDGNAFLRAVLGLLALGQALDRLLDRHAPPRASEENLGPDDAVLDALLGAVALRQRVVAALERAAVEPKPSSGPPRPIETALLGLLR